MLLQKLPTRQATCIPFRFEAYPHLNRSAILHPRCEVLKHLDMMWQIVSIDVQAAQLANNRGRLCCFGLEVENSRCIVSVVFDIEGFSLASSGGVLVLKLLVDEREVRHRAIKV